MPTPVTKEQEREWVRAWERAGRAMEALRARELRHLTERESARAFNEIGCPVPLVVRPSSGLVEQQYFFSKLLSQHQAG